ncbi:hypothetical protein GCK72_016569 [Caenorhabditis remanei]|uniref:Phosphomevalonate kinase n=1 Tax=Caenorhabditis remanei TaxID=31234 RepID=A0A6A5G611_CAERE|nr:hypothetical protein GCK72_016569 [Caenorhabditis remanei]KAF1750024.1 hypothetical protein GCK72_016569 [Caenorhabditis remanei]
MVKFVIAISGKRKSGKDYCAKLIKESLASKGVSVSAVGISHSLKEEYAKIHDLNFAELLTDGPYKEKYRKDMILWGEEARNKDFGVFCRAAIKSVIDSDVVIVSDCRRLTDYAYFNSNFNSLTIRVETSEENRKERGFRFVEGVDDTESECGLDNYKFDVVLKNLTGEELAPQIEAITGIVINKL